MNTTAVAASDRTPVRTRGASVADLRAAVAPLVAAGDVHDLTEFLLAAYGLMYDKKQELERLVAKLSHVGRRSERVDPGQLALLIEHLRTVELPSEVLDRTEEELSSQEDAAVDRAIAAAEAAAPAGERGRPRSPVG